MIFWFLTGSLIFLLVSLLISNAPLFAVSVVTFVVSLAALKLSSRFLLLSFWIWVNLVLLYLCSRPAPAAGASGSHLFVLGLPLPAFWMLFGIWIFPVLIWPAGFAFTFRSWMRE